MKMEKVKSWFYQLQGVPHGERHEDLIVIDIDENPKPLLIKPDGIPRAVAAYLSIGEAEDYRAYWHRMHERLAKDPIVLGENPEWKGNYTVKYWKPEWQAIIIARAKEAKAKGFTALYLDKVDAYEDIADKWPRWAETLDLEAAMVNFVKAIAAAVPELDIIMQNAEGLTDHAPLLAAIDAIGKEDLFYGAEDTGQHNSRDAIMWSLGQLKKAHKPVYVIEYLDNSQDKKLALQMIQRVGYVPFFDEEDRALDGA